MGLKAIMVVKNSQGSEEIYRFFYPYQQISKSIFEVKKETDKNTSYFSDGLMQIVIWAILIGVATYLAYFIYHKMIKKCLNGRRRSQDSMGIEINYNEFSGENWW